ncbi:PREDICTED: polyubiquitin-like isoform X1 [Nicotiana attenuata]|uniref:Polyubiquitin 4 n=2 Tax=Nicotiana attenuata TaxID=49451 RepID=A0A1J6KC86_NICAT|nr:PREDICTED: polyubiquitin-like isoform X1 [Nicotiana attenuata]OIT27674.1 polyubiquitin 4 [Nicotiana attenuata]
MAELMAIENSSEQKANPNGEEEMDIYVKVIKTVPLKVKKSDTIKSVKTLLYHKEGVQEYRQELVFAGNQIKDDQKLVHFGIHQNSSIDVYVKSSESLRLFVTIPHSEITDVFEAKSIDRIRDIKDLIGTKHGIRFYQYALVYNGKLLEDDKTLGFLKVPSESTLHILFVRSEKLLASVKMPCGKISELEVKVWHTVNDLKTLLERQLGYSLGVCTLLYEGKKLEDSKMLLSYNVEQKSRFVLMSPFIQVFIKSNGGSMTLDALPTDLVRDLKLKILDKAGIPMHIQSLDFEGKVLQDSRNLASYNIQKNSTIRLALWKKHVRAH